MSNCRALAIPRPNGGGRRYGSRLGDAVYVIWGTRSFAGLVPEREPDLRSLDTAAEAIAFDEDRAGPREVRSEHVVEFDLNTVAQACERLADVLGYESTWSVSPSSWMRGRLVASCGPSS